MEYRSVDHIKSYGGAVRVDPFFMVFHTPWASLNFKHQLVDGARVN